MEITNLSGGGESLYTENTITTPKTLTDLSITGTFGTNETVSISFRGTTEAEIKFITNGVLLSPDTETTAHTLNYPNDTTITFLASGTGTINISNIALYITNENNANDIDKLKVTLNNINYFGEDININTHPIILENSGGGSHTVHNSSPVEQSDLRLNGHFKTGNTLQITFNGDSTNSEALKFRTSGITANDGTTNLPITYTNNIISFIPTGSTTLTVSGIGIYLDSHDGTIDTEKLKITLNEETYFGDDFNIGTPPLTISGGGGGPISNTAIDPLTATPLNTLQIDGEFFEETVFITFEGNETPTPSLHFKQTDITITSETVTIANLNITETSIDFKANGKGTITLSNLEAFVSDPCVIENGQKRLIVTVNTTAKYGDYFSVITPPPLYPDLSGSFSGATGPNGIFRAKDKITYTPPTNKGETFLIDLTSLGLSSTSSANTAYIIPEGLVDNTATSFLVSVSDNVCNTSSFQTPSIAIDNQKPITNTTNLLNLNGTSPAKPGTTINVIIPTDISNNDTITFSIDLSSIGGPEAVFTDITEAPQITVTEGIYENQNFSTTFTLTDEAGNTSTFNTDPIWIDNKMPTFDLSCGATFTVIDDDPTPNKIADFAYGNPDTVIFKEPDQTIPGCEFATYSIDLSHISNNETHKFEDAIADGEYITIPVGAGDLDAPNLTFVLRIKNTSGNQSTYTSGTLNIDNDLFDSTQTSFKYELPDPTIPTSGEYYQGTIFPIALTTVENDLEQIQISVQGASETFDLNHSNEYDWTGSLFIAPGKLVNQKKNIVLKIRDDAGNTLEYIDPQDILITNIHIPISSNTGGVPNLHNPPQKSTGRKVVREQNHQAIKKHTETLKQKTSDPPSPLLEKLKRTLKINHDYYFISPLEKQLIKNKTRHANQKKKKDTLKNKLKKIISNQTKQKKWKTFEDNQGGFRLQNSLKRLKKQIKKQKPTPIRTLRKTDQATKGRYGKIRIK